MARILVIDDQADIRDVLKEMLEEAGHDVRVATEGGEGLGLHAKSPADLVITDLHMPGMNGLETVRALRERSSSVKIVAMSGADTYMAETNLASSVINGADLTLTKPFSMQAMLRAITTLLTPVQA